MRLLLTAAIALTLAACAPVPPDDGDGGTDVVTCQDDPRVSAWKAGLSVTSADGAVKVVVDSASPTTPVRGLNRWTVSVDGPDGSPLASPDVVVKPWMPDHGHGASVQPTVTPSGGRYQVDDLDLFMPGVWQVQFSVTPASGTKEVVTVGLCIAG